MTTNCKFVPNKVCGRGLNQKNSETECLMTVSIAQFWKNAYFGLNGRYRVTNKTIQHVKNIHTSRVSVLALHRPLKQVI